MARSLLLLFPSSLLLALVFLSGAQVTLLAQPQRPDALSWSTIDNGGGTSTNGFFGLSGTVGQTDAETMKNEYSGMMSNNVYQIQGGFWAASVRTRPLIALPPLSTTNANFGSNVTFRATPVGTPPFQFQWQLNGVNLAGATNDTLSIVNVQFTNGGTYRCIIVNEFGVTNSGIAQLQFNLPVWPPQPGGTPLNDDFANRSSIALTNESFRSSNVGATNETGEKRHAGKLGGSSVWYTWSTNASGIATFRTEGSAFDTLLAVYTGDSLATLVEAAEDDDSGGSYASIVRFNVSTGAVYQIAVDGVGGAQGGFVVRWDFEATTERLPRITCHPKSQSVRRGTDAMATFAVEVDGGTNQPGLRYQWHFIGDPIAGATNATLAVSNITVFKLGFYSVAVTNADNQGLESHRASLEFGPKSTAVSYSKIEDLLVNSGLFGGASEECGQARLQVASASLNLQSVTFGVGSVHDARFVNLDGSTAQCPNACDDFGGAAKYYGLQPTNSGVLTLSTYGSTNSRAGKMLDTILIVYEYKPDYIDLNNNLYKSSECAFEIACDDDGGPDGSSQISISVAADRYYVVEVDGKNGETGEVALNWRLDAPATPFEYNGNLLYLAAPTNLSLYPYVTSYSWLANNLILPGYTERTLLLNGPVVPATTYAVAMYVQNANATYWSVARVTNTLGTIVSASIRQTNGFQLVLPGLASGTLRTNFQVEGTTGPGTNFGAAWQWQKLTNLRTNTDGNDLILSLPTNQPAQFLRLRPKTR